MAQKKKDEGGGEFIFLIVIFSIIGFVIIVVAPIIFISGYVYYYFRYKKSLGHMEYSKFEPDFGLTDLEKKRLKEIESEMVEIRAQIDNAHKIASKEGISRNMDLRYNARSDRGKEIQKYIDSNYKHISSLNDERKHVLGSPEYRWRDFYKSYNFDEFYNFYKKYKSFQISTLVWFFLVIISQIGLFKISISFLDIFKFGYNVYFGFKHDDIFTIATEEHWIVMLIITGLSIISYFITNFISYRHIQRAFPKPVFVNKIDYL